MIQHIELDLLIPNERNPRTIKKEAFEKLKKNIKEDPEFLECRPLCAYSKDGKYVVYAGNQRLQAIKQLGWKQAPVEVTDGLPERKLKKRILLDNHPSGEDDDDILASDFDLDLLEECGLDEILADLVQEIPTDEEAENEVLEPPKDPITKLGDLYQLGNHRLLCGDSTNPDDVAKLLDGSEPILMVTDPPYGVNYNPNWRGKQLKDGAKRSEGKVQNDGQINWALAWHLFPGSVAYVWSSDKYAYESVASLKECNYEIINQIIWVKQHFTLSRGDYHSQHEPCWYAVKKGHQHNWQGSRKESTIWEIANLNCFGKSKDSDDERTAHSTQKPLECMERPIRNNTAQGEGVYDPFLGSGTTLIAAEKQNRVCYGMELDPAYCDIIVERYKNYCFKNGKEPKVLKNGQET